MAEYKSGDKVSIEISPKVYVTAELVIPSVFLVFRNGKADSEWVVRVEQTGKLESYYESQFVTGGVSDLSKCTCGARAVYHPIPPPGHGPLCELSKV